MKFEILAVKPPGDGADARIKGYVTFGYFPSAFDPVVKVVRSYKQQDEWKTAKVADVVCAPGSCVKVHNAFVKVSDDGELYVQVQNIELPWEMSKAIALQAVGMIDGQPERKPAAAANTEGGGW